MGRNALYPCAYRSIALAVSLETITALPLAVFCHGFRGIHGHLCVPVKGEGKMDVETASANGSEVCRLKRVDNHGLALSSSRGCFNCVVSSSSSAPLSVHGNRGGWTKCKGCCVYRMYTWETSHTHYMNHLYGMH